jgi:two-component system LytT family sensor kinase
MKFKARYRFLYIFWVVLGLYILVGLISMIALALVPTEAVKISSIFTKAHIIRTCLGFLFTVLFFYFTTNYYFQLLATRQKFIAFLKVSMVAVLACCVFEIGAYYFFPNKNMAAYSSTALLVFSTLLNTFFYIGVSLLAAYLTNLRDGQKQRKVLEAQKLQLEVEKSQANFNFLKAQINPHFLHNTLNFLYAKSLPYSVELSEGILTLSDIMRYALSEGNAKDGKAPLKDEIEHVRNVIKINQLRFNNNLNVHFEVNGVINGAVIIPFLLITLAENAFKHGDLKTQQSPIEMKLTIDKDQLYFYCRNKKKTGPKEMSTGIGLENIKNRLDLAYGNAYTLNIKDEPEFYTTELTITRL